MVTTKTFLGTGSSGDVYIVKCRGVELAQKKIRVDLGLAHSHEQKLQEIFTLNKLHYRYIVRFVGAYRQGSILGILLWPVAVCNLKEFPYAVSEDPTQKGDKRKDIRKRLSLDTFWSRSREEHKARSPIRYIKGAIGLRQMFGCLAEALSYVHEVGLVANKDVKSENILVTPENVYFTDFGSSRDLSEKIRQEGISMTAGEPIGTSRYWPPETNTGGHGRRVDVFLLGCVYLEMLTVMLGYTIVDSDDFIRQQGKRHGANVPYNFHYCEHIREAKSWLKSIRPPPSSKIPMHSLWNTDGLFDLIESMLAGERDARPRAYQVSNTLHQLGGSVSVFHNRCCLNTGLAESISRTTELGIFGVFIPFDVTIIVLIYLSWLDSDCWKLVEALLVTWNVPETVALKAPTAWSHPVKPPILRSHLCMWIDLALVWLIEVTLNYFGLTPATALTLALLLGQYMSNVFDETLDAILAKPNTITTPTHSQYSLPYTPSTHDPNADPNLNFTISNFSIFRLSMKILLGILGILFSLFALGLYLLQPIPRPNEFLEYLLFQGVLLFFMTFTEIVAIALTSGPVVNELWIGVVFVLPFIVFSGLIPLP